MENELVVWTLELICNFCFNAAQHEAMWGVNFASYATIVTLNKLYVNFTFHSNCL